MTETTDPGAAVEPEREADGASPVDAAATAAPGAGATVDGEDTADTDDAAAGALTDGASADGDDTDGDDTDGDDTDSDGAEGGDGTDEPHDELIAEGDAAGDYLERLLDILDYDGDIDLDVEGERAVVSIVGQGDIEKLVGERGEVLNALQELTRLAAGMETGSRSRLMLDIGGYRARRREELTELGRETAEQVVASGEPVTLGAMNPFERKVVHDAVAGVSGASSSSVGEEPRRRVVVSPAG